MSTTPHIALTLLESGGSNNHILTNTALMWFDALTGSGVVERTDTPPGSVVEGALYLLTGAPSGAWSDQSANDLALGYNGGWVFLTPDSLNEGLTLYVQDENKPYRWDGSAWSVALEPVVGTVDLGSLGSTETFDWDAGKRQTGVLSADLTATNSNAADGKAIMLSLSYSGAQRAITWSHVDKWDGGSPPPTPAASGEVLIVTLWQVGDTVFGSGTVFS